MGFKISNEELDLFLKLSDGNVAVLFLLIAIRCTCQGGPGREMGVEDKKVDTLEKQVRWAAIDIFSKERAYGKTARDSVTRLFTDSFLAFFSGKHPRDISWSGSFSGDHLRNLRFFHSRCRIALGEVS